MRLDGDCTKVIQPLLTLVRTSGLTMLHIFIVVVVSWLYGVTDFLGCEFNPS